MRCRRMHFDLRLLVASGLLLLAIPHAARADMGPCRKVADGGTMCGEGKNAALVLKGTVSPSKRLAFAWREPDDVPKFDGGDVELLLVRLADGAILAQLKGEYWETADGGRANRADGWTVWSAYSRVAVEIFNNRWDATITLYGLAADDAVGKPLDLVKLVEAAAIASFQPGERASSPIIRCAPRTARALIRMAPSACGYFSISAKRMTPTCGST